MWCWFCVGGVSGVGQCGGGVCHGNGGECSDGKGWFFFGGVSKCGDNVCRGNGGECGDGRDESGDGGAQVVSVLVAGVKDGVVVVMVA